MRAGGYLCCGQKSVSVACRHQRHGVSADGIRRGMESDKSNHCLAIIGQRISIGGKPRRGRDGRVFSTWSDFQSRSRQDNNPQSGDMSERSGMVNREVVLFLLQLELDSQLQRALTYDRFDQVKDLRERRNKVDGALREMQKSKGYGCGSRRAAQSDQFGNLAPVALSIRAKLSRAIEDEDYALAASLRDSLAEIEEQSAEANMPCPVGEPDLALGQMIIHNTKGYRGVVCGWDFACCEGDVWKRESSASTLKSGTDQVFYHILVDIADWPIDDDEIAPVAYVAEELLDKVTLADFDSDEPLVNTPFQHPYSYLMFLGTDGHGNLIPCRQLREKYCVDRKDVYRKEDGESDDDDSYSDSDGGDDGDPPSPDSSWGGGNSIPGIDMSSLD